MPLPPLEDDAFWRSIAETDDWRDDHGAAMTLTDLMRAFVTRGDEVARRVEGAVARRIMTLAGRFVRNNVGRHHRNAGYDVVDDVLCEIMEAMAEPGGKVAKGLSVSFETRTRFLIIDAVRASKAWAIRSSAIDDENEGALAAPLVDVDGEIERAQTLARITDERDRRMLQDHYDGHTWQEIGKRHGCDESTVRRRLQRLVAAAWTGQKTRRRA